MYKKIPYINFKHTSLNEFHKIFGYNNYNIIYHNFNSFYNKVRVIDSKLYGIYIDINYGKQNIFYKK